MRFESGVKHQSLTRLYDWIVRLVDFGFGIAMSSLHQGGEALVLRNRNKRHQDPDVLFDAVRFNIFLCVHEEIETLLDDPWIQPFLPVALPAFVHVLIVSIHESFGGEQLLTLSIS